MIKEDLLNNQEIVYKTLENALKNNRLAQTILLSGPPNPLKLDTAFLIAQSIIEGHNDFADENSKLSKRIKDGDFFDLVYIDGSKETIKKEKIEMLYSRFMETALEINNKKVFIINNINNATAKVLNMLLKYIEEPQENIYGIFITDEIDSLLDTIKSRCQIIPFRETSDENIKNKYLNDGFEALDAYLLTKMYHEYIKLDLNDEMYLNAKDMVEVTIESLKTKGLLAIEFNNHLYTYKDKNLKAITSNYVDLMIIYLNDAIGNDLDDELEYQMQLNKLKEYHIYELLKIFMEVKDKFKYNYDRKLIMDQAAYQISQII